MEQIGIKVVVIGGGTGSFNLLSGLKNYTHNITALVNMADDGGSTGTLRDELGVLPPGDIRKCLAALSSTPKVRDLFNYRFEEGSLKGHAFGNLFMAALEKMTGNFAEAVETASEVLNIKGNVEPMTLDNVTLVMETSDGNIIRGEENVSYGTKLPDGEKPLITLDPVATLNPKAKEAILEADLVVIAPGLLYTSIAAALVVDGVKEALDETEAKKIYVCNLVTKRDQMSDYNVSDFADEIERFSGTKLDYVMYNNYTPVQELVDKYANDGEFLVSWDEKELSKKHYRAVGKKFIDDGAEAAATKRQEFDPLGAHRSLIRHDADRVARELMRIYFA